MPIHTGIPDHFVSHLDVFTNEVASQSRGEALSEALSINAGPQVSKLHRLRYHLPHIHEGFQPL